MGLFVWLLFFVVVVCDKYFCLKPTPNHSECERDRKGKVTAMQSQDVHGTDETLVEQ